MDWNEFIKTEIESSYKATEGLMDLVDGNQLEWKPSTENNWMTTGQLLMHVTSACGACIRGFVTGDWGMPEDFDPNDMSPENMLPPAEKMPMVASVTEAKDLLARDKPVGLAALAECDNDRLANEHVAAPWNPIEMKLGSHLLHMIGHLNQHKDQLFYYLKLQGKPVNTSDLWGM